MNDQVRQELFTVSTDKRDILSAFWQILFYKFVSQVICMKLIRLRCAQKMYKFFYRALTGTKWPNCATSVLYASTVWRKNVSTMVYYPLQIICQLLSRILIPTILVHDLKRGYQFSILPARFWTEQCLYPAVNNSSTWGTTSPHSSHWGFVHLRCRPGIYILHIFPQRGCHQMYCSCTINQDLIKYDCVGARYTDYCHFIVSY